ncbi:MAG: hypothetical protein GAK45_00912 [Pseudomonas citronellolis]|nr:MAG: hypothetical protein GAK45_00912 [Pseudomonas citronellolis]
MSPVRTHVGGEGVEDQRAASGEAKHGEESALVVGEQLGEGAGLAALEILGLGGLVQRTTQIEGDHRGDGARHERNPPAPAAQFIGAEQLLQNHHHQHGEQLAADQGDVLERGEEAALPLERDFAHVGGAGAVLAAHRQPLEQPREQQQARGEDTDGFVGRHHGDGQRATAHHQHGNHHGRLAAFLVGDTTEQPATDGTHQEARSEHPGAVEQLHGGVVGGEESVGEVDGGEGVDVEVKPLDQVAGG